jgi:hypothetical protein
MHRIATFQTDIAEQDQSGTDRATEFLRSRRISARR